MENGKLKIENEDQNTKSNQIYITNHSGTADIYNQVYFTILAKYRQI